ncbi:kinase [Micromonospora sp. DH14]|uniref:kinase n=1 Tax=Micromonospora sp. DH14 TaxID=3040120 RepID=UPI0024430741|nr:kinase [Micromonospora sp. DH14]MDG9678254.1 kinase [Micromonospora sp. DH14]
MRVGIILYGPPAAGKDTVTQALHSADTRCSLFKRLKVGGGRTDGYRVISESQLADLADRGEIVWENRRYGAVYAVDRTGLSTHSASGVPVLHLGQSAAIEAVRDADRSIAWLVVYLWCARDIAEQRMRGRNTGDVPARLSAWDSTESIEADLRIDTGTTDPDRAAGQILLAMGKLHAHN